MTRYFLGELSREECVELEETCFSDDQYFEELQAVEAELTDDYVRGRLTGPRRERFEQRLLNTPGLRDEVEFARIITAASSAAGAPADEAGEAAAAPPHSRRRSPVRESLLAWLGVRGRAWSVSLATAALVLLAVGLWSLWPYGRTDSGPERAARDSAPASVRPTESPSPPASQSAEVDHTAEAPPPGTVGEPADAHSTERAGATTPRRPTRRDTPTRSPQPTIISLVLTPGFERGAGGANELNVPRGAGRVRLLLPLERGDYPSYRAALRTVEGREILTRRGMKARAAKSGRALTLELSAGEIPAGDFILTLSGATARGEFEDIDKYFLSVSKK